VTTEPTTARAIIIHGYAATPSDHWFGWLAEHLEFAGIPTLVPALPVPEAPDPRSWLNAAQQIGVPDEDTILIAHSLGCLTVLRYLAAQQEPWRLGTLILVAGFLDPLPALPNLDGYIGEGCDVSSIPGHIGRLTVIRSDDDPYVPTDHTDRLARQLMATPQVVTGAGHFLAENGVTTVPEVLEKALTASTPADSSTPHHRRACGQLAAQPALPRPTVNGRAQIADATTT
jgi:predicted alpha/beta hydrolase family esterase